MEHLEGRKLLAANLLNNGDFSENTVSGKWDIFYYGAHDEVPAAESNEVKFAGWDVEGTVELWSSHWVELDADENGPKSRWNEDNTNPARRKLTKQEKKNEKGSSSLSQEVTVEDGKLYALSFDFKGRGRLGESENVLEVSVSGATDSIEQTYTRGKKEKGRETIHFRANADGDVKIEFADGGIDNTRGTLIRKISLKEADFSLDLQNDANNDGEINASDDPHETKENAGKVRVNTDDDNDNDVEDFNDNTLELGVTGENDLKELKVQWLPQQGEDFTGYQMTLHWGDQQSSEHVRIWTNANKASAGDDNGQLDLNTDGSEENTKTWDLAGSDITETFYVEGLKVGSASFLLKVWSPTGELVKSDTVVFTVIPERIIWLTGYWAPTNTDGMLAEFKQAQKNYKKSGFTVKAIDFTVNYEAVSKKFWDTAADDRPIAILSYGLAGNAKRWEMETVATNLPGNAWGTGTYGSTDGVNGTPLPTGTPIAGGHANDHSPYQGEGATANGRPDPSKAANHDRDLFQNIDLDQLAADINALGSDINAQKATDSSCGEFLCEYMAYHGAWYVDWTTSSHEKNDTDIHQKAKVSGFTHVDSGIPTARAKAAMKLQLDAVIELLEPDY